jgi:hypothetical protein
MPTSKKGKKRGSKKSDSSTKQSVKQSVIVNVNTESKSKSKSSKKRQPSNTKVFTKGSSYLGGTPFRSMTFPTVQHPISMPQAATQPIFTSDIVNRLSALENMRRSQMTDMQQAQSIVQPLATQTPTANKPIDIATPPSPAMSALSAPPIGEQYEQKTLQALDVSRRSTMDEFDTIRNMSRGMFSDQEDYTTPIKQNKSIEEPTSAFNPMYEKSVSDDDNEIQPLSTWGGKRTGAGRLKNVTKQAAVIVEGNANMRRKREAFNAFKEAIKNKQGGYEGDSEE